MAPLARAFLRGRASAITIRRKRAAPPPAPPLAAPPPPGLLPLPAPAAVAAPPAAWASAVYPAPAPGLWLDLPGLDTVSLLLEPVLSGGEEGVAPPLSGDGALRFS